ncbi:MAG: hypothetical protein VXY53_06700, partial [Candidatus Thermoplasmatota archaeon]|nr:hypothetical protein [Candidatus Thermoplasmatota archaeon]
MVPMVGKGERLEVCFEIKGSGEVDGDVLNKFHGVHFGDEIETDDLPETEVESKEETPEETASESADEVSNDEEAKPKVTWREDVLLRVMDAHGIDAEQRDAFVEHAVNFDLDDNGYLKKAELEEAAKAWNDDNSPVEEAVAEEAGEELMANEEHTDEGKTCPVCSTMAAIDVDTCVACGFSYAAQ